MAKLPFLKFFPDEYLSDEKLRLCSSAARGLWTDIICLMHKSVRRGYLQQSSGKPYSLEQIARINGHPTDEVSQWLQELIDAGAFSANDTMVLFSRRMVKEHGIYLARKSAGQKGGFATAKTQQTDSKDGSKPPSNLLPSGILPSGFSSPEELGGVGERETIIDFDLSPADLAQLFAFHSTLPLTHQAKDAIGMTPWFDSLSKQVDPAKIRTEILLPDGIGYGQRDHGELPWQFKARLTGEKNGKPQRSSKRFRA